MAIFPTVPATAFLHSLRFCVSIVAHFLLKFLPEFHLTFLILPFLDTNTADTADSRSVEHKLAETVAERDVWLTVLALDLLFHSTYPLQLHSEEVRPPHPMLERDC